MAIAKSHAPEYKCCTCGGASEADQTCQEARALYQELRENAENPDTDGDGSVSVTEQLMFDALSGTTKQTLDDFVVEWYAMAALSTNGRRYRLVRLLSLVS